MDVLQRFDLGLRTAAFAGFALAFLGLVAIAHGAELPNDDELDQRADTAIELSQFPPLRYIARGAEFGDPNGIFDLPNGDFLQRFGLRDFLGVEYWALNGDTREVIATIAAEPRSIASEQALGVFVSLTTLRNRVVCGGGGPSHIARVMVVSRLDMDRVERLGMPGAQPLFTGIVRNDEKGWEPVRVYGFRNWPLRH